MFWQTITLTSRTKKIYYHDIAPFYVTVVNSGTCPADDDIPEDTAGVCTLECIHDGDCSTNQKCCSNGCGHVCMEAVAIGTYKSPPPPHTHTLECIRGRMRIPIFSGNGVICGRLSRADPDFVFVFCGSDDVERVHTYPLILRGGGGGV